MCAARDLLELPDLGRMSLEAFSGNVLAQQWEAKDFSHGSPAVQYLEQLKAQLEESARRIPCAAGGSVPHVTQQLVWGWMQARIMQECVEILAKCGKRKSQEALFVFAEDFRTLRAAMQLHFQDPDGEPPLLLPPDHLLAVTTTWQHLENYIEGHAVLESEVLVWCKRHMEFPLRLHKALIEYMCSGVKSQRINLQELEAYVAAQQADGGNPLL